MPFLAFWLRSSVVSIYSIIVFIYICIIVFMQPTYAYNLILMLSIINILLYTYSIIVMHFFIFTVKYFFNVTLINLYNYNLIFIIFFIYSHILTSPPLNQHFVLKFQRGKKKVLYPLINKSYTLYPYTF